MLKQSLTEDLMDFRICSLPPTIARTLSKVSFGSGCWVDRDGGQKEFYGSEARIKIRIRSQIHSFANTDFICAGQKYY